jgi:MFS family permease
VSGGLGLERLLPIACLGGAVLLVVSQFMTMFELNDAFGGTQQVVEGPDQHWYTMVILGGFAICALAGAIATGSKPLATSVAVAGAVALLLFLLIDLPDAGKAGDIESATESLVIVEADPAGGFWLELIGALILVVCGGALSTLSSAQLSALRPRRRRMEGGAGRRRRGLESASPWPGRDVQGDTRKPLHEAGEAARGEPAASKPAPGGESRPAPEARP